MALTGWRDRMFVPTLVVIGLVTATLGSLGAPLIPTLSAASHVNLSTGQWLLTSTQLAAAVAAPIMGQLGDGRFRRHVLLGALVTVLVGSVLAATLNGFAVLVVARSLQGVGMGLAPVAMVMARHHLPPRRSATAIAVLSTIAAVGIGLGYPLTGLIAESFDYHVAFWAGAVVVVVALILALVVLPKESTTATSHLDGAGAALFSVALVALLTALSEATVLGWTSPWIIAMVVVAVLLGVVFVRHELRVHHPMIVLSQLRIPTVLATDLAALVMSIAMYLFLPALVEFVQISPSHGYGFGVSVAVAGLCLVPMSLGTALATPVVRLARERFGARVTMSSGLLLFAGTLLFFAFEHSALWEAFVAMGIGGIAMGLSFGTMPGFIVAAVPASEVGAAMGLYVVVRSVGFAIGSCIGAVVLGAFTLAHQTVPSVDGYRVELLVAAGLCLLALPLSRLFPARSVARAVPAATVEGDAAAVRVTASVAGPRG